MINGLEKTSPPIYQQALGVPMVLADHKDLIADILMVVTDLEDGTVPRQTSFTSSATHLGETTPLNLGRRIGMSHIGLNYSHQYDFIAGDSASISLYGTDIGHNARLTLDLGAWGFTPQGCDKPLRYLSHGDIIEFLDAKIANANFGPLVDQVTFENESVLTAIEKVLRPTAKRISSSKTYSEESWGMIGPKGSYTAPTTAQLHIAELQSGGSRYTLSVANQIEILMQDSVDSNKIIKQLNYSFEACPSDNIKNTGRFNNFSASICLTSLDIDNSGLKKILRLSKERGDDIVQPLSRSLDTLTQSLFGRLSA